jgi:hypothetical protein
MRIDFTNIPVGSGETETLKSPVLMDALKLPFGRTAPFGGRGVQ